jgi:hypothetical protein
MRNKDIRWSKVRALVTKIAKILLHAARDSYSRSNIPLVPRLIGHFYSKRSARLEGKQQSSSRAEAGTPYNMEVWLKASDEPRMLDS